MILHEITSNQLDEYNEYADGKKANFAYEEIAEIDKEDYYNEF